MVHFLQMEGALRVRGTHRASDTVPHRQQVLLLSCVQSQCHQAQQFFASADLHPSIPITTPPPPRAGSRTDPPLLVLPLVATVICQLTWCTSIDGLFYGHGAQLPLTPGFSGGPGQPILMTVSWPTKQDPGYCLGPALCPYGQGEQRRRMCVCVCVCVCVYTCTNYT